MDTIRQGEQFKKLFQLPDSWEMFEDIAAKFYIAGEPDASFTFSKSEGTISDESASGEKLIGLFFSQEKTSLMTPGKWSVEFKLEYAGSFMPIWKPAVEVFNVKKTQIT